jgi:hypothetical protein
MVDISRSLNLRSLIQTEELKSSCTSWMIFSIPAFSQMTAATFGLCLAEFTSQSESTSLHLLLRNTLFGFLLKS